MENRWEWSENRWERGGQVAVWSKNRWEWSENRWEHGEQVGMVREQWERGRQVAVVRAGGSVEDRWQWSENRWECGEQVGAWRTGGSGQRTGGSGQRTVGAWRTGGSGRRAGGKRSSLTGETGGSHSARALCRVASQHPARPWQPSALGRVHACQSASSQGSPLRFPCLFLNIRLSHG
ncbi:uncharacterized protein LOC121020174 isoform X14 [Herpailurus yagouaroundi]|uniref:uncharacterized protein LOC121020174 isoform X14 n=1 Tax=Herpailurus yagouaroundi TaxID=1608482 RepID=UPI001AD64561|nr:uncharacterized protein LOC121020174 isoform X14 [Puma yagouaroundi]